jgi:hypothetical protein
MQEEKIRKRPLFVWLIVVFYVVVYGLNLITLVLFGLIHLWPLDAGEKEALERLLGFDSLGNWILFGINSTGIVLLFRLRKSAVAWFAIGLILDFALSFRAGQLIWSWDLLVGLLVGSRPLGDLVPSLIIVVYAVDLRRRGILV